MVSIVLTRGQQSITITVQSDGGTGARRCRGRRQRHKGAGVRRRGGTRCYRRAPGRCATSFAAAASLRAAKKMEAAMDPYRLPCLAAALAGDKAEGRWVELLRLAANETFLGVHAKVGGRDAVDLWCWTRRPRCGSAIMRTCSCVRCSSACREVSNLSHDMLRVDEVLTYGLEHDFFMAE